MESFFFKFAKLVIFDQKHSDHQRLSDTENEVFLVFVWLHFL